MKLKTVYILALICCASLISSAKQKACNGSCCKMQEQLNKSRLIKASRAGYDLSPLNHFVLNS